MIRKVWPLVVAAVSLGIDAYVLAGVLPQIAESLATTVGGIGLGVTAFTGAYAVAGTTLSKRAGARSTKAGLLISLGVFNVANLITALSPNLGVFLGSRVLAGAGAGVLTALATAAAASLVSSDQRGRAMALVTFGLSTGTVAGVPIGMLIGEQIGWRWTMGLVVAVGVVSMAALAFRGGSMPPIPNRARLWRRSAEVTASRLRRGPRIRFRRDEPRPLHLHAANGRGSRARSLGLRPHLGVGHRRRGGLDVHRPAHRRLRDE